MIERINRKTDHKIYQPRIHSKRIRELRVVREFTHRPMTVILDEAISFYLSTFFTSPDYKTYEEAMWQKESEAEEPTDPNLDDYEDLANFIDNA